MRPTPPPRDLGDAGRALWRDVARQVADDDAVMDARERRWLALACSEADQLARVEAELAGADLTVRGSQGQPVANGLLSEARQSRQTIARLLKMIGLEEPAAVPVGRGGRTTSTSARSAAQARWRVS